MKMTPEQVIAEIEHDLAQTVERNYYLREQIEKLEAELSNLTADLNELIKLHSQKIARVEKLEAALREILGETNTAIIDRIAIDALEEK